MSDRLVEEIRNHQPFLDPTTQHAACRCGWRSWGGTTGAYVSYHHAPHLAAVVRRHLMDAKLPWSSGLEARNTGMAMAQVRADELADGALTGVDDVSEAAREGWDR